MPSPAHPRVAAVTRLLRAAGASGEVRVLPTRVRTAAAAAAALGVPVGAIADSLVLVAAGQPLLVLTSAAHRVEETAVAGLLGVDSVSRAPAELVRRVTGQPIGGVAPVGHPEPLGTLVDVELARYEQVWAAAGDPAAVFPTTYAELLRLTDGAAAEVGGGAPDAPGPAAAGPRPHEAPEVVGT